MLYNLYVCTGFNSSLSFIPENPHTPQEQVYLINFKYNYSINTNLHNNIYRKLWTSATYVELKLTEVWYSLVAN